MKLLQTLIFFLVYGLSKLWAIDSPVIQCISLNEDDDINLTWSLPIDTGASFSEYLIYYRSGSATQFTILSSVTDYNQSSITIPGSFSGSGNFFIVTANSVDTSVATDTISPLIIALFSSGRIVDVTWQETNIESNDSLYSIWRRDTSGVWQLLGKVPFGIEIYKDSTSVCEAAFEYRVTFNGIGGCENSSNIGFKLVKDNEPPITSNLIYASVDTATGNVNVGWDLSVSSDVLGYRIFYYEDFLRSDTVFDVGVLSHTYSDFGIDALSQTETLSVAPFDSCFDSNTMWYNQAPTSLRFQTLFIETLDYQRCEGTTTIIWNMPSVGYPVGVRNLTGFNVYRQRQGEQPELRAVLTPLDSVFLDGEIIPGKKYTYVVAAVDSFSKIEALSNKLIYDVSGIPAPEIQYIAQVQNNHESGLNEVELLTDSISSVFQFKLMRSFDQSKTFQSIAVKDFEPQTRFKFIDNSGRAGEASYFYRIDAFDECGAFLSSSNVVKSIFVNADKNQKNYFNEVFWNPYSGFDADIDSYHLYRAPADVASEEIYSGTASASFTDELEGVEYLSGEICYYIEALENEGNQYGAMGISRSNLFCLDFSPKVFLPNAFSPDGDGINDVFLPYANYVDQVNYHLSVYNRIGNLIFESADPAEGWPGTDEEVGVYVYVLELTNAFGETVVFKEKVHLMR
ncbi:MAG: gliding motility-associated C-terminal domain-containing protein [Salibacteraceae bacterium]|nr:gliding motility-associated C-terminal domain-containing protein [Salibacteraceae bacterium]